MTDLYHKKRERNTMYPLLLSKLTIRQLESACASVKEDMKVEDPKDEDKLKEILENNELGGEA